MKKTLLAMVAIAAVLAAAPAEARHRGGRTTVITQAAPTVDVGTALLLGLLGQGNAGLTTGLSFGSNLAGLSTGGCNNGLVSPFASGLVSPSTVIIQDQARRRHHHRVVAPGPILNGGGGGPITELPALQRRSRVR